VKRRDWWAVCLGWAAVWFVFASFISFWPGLVFGFLSLAAVRIPVGKHHILARGMHRKDLL
jgi:hypothetical protein